MLDLRSTFGVSLATLRESPLRTLLSMLGIIIGVASLVTILSLADGLDQFIRSEIGANTDLQLISLSSRATRSVDGTAIPRSDTIRFSDGDIRSLQAYVGSSTAVGLTATGTALAIVNGAERVVHILGISTGLTGILKFHVISGRLLSIADTNTPTLLLSSMASRELAAPGHRPLAPGDSITLGGATHVIVGILDGDQFEKATAAAMPVSRARNVVVADGRDFLPSILIHAATLEAVGSVRARTEGWLAARFTASWKERVAFGGSASAVAYAERGMLLFKLVMSAITGIALLVGGIGIMNVLLAAIAERTREIGVRRAAGATRGHIKAQFLAEAVTIAGAGSAIGVVLGFAGAYGITAVLRAQTQAQVHAGISLRIVVVAVIATVAVGLSFGLYPALRAAKLSPIDAIRHE